LFESHRNLKNGYFQQHVAVTFTASLAHW